MSRPDALMLTLRELAGNYADETGSLRQRLHLLQEVEQTMFDDVAEAQKLEFDDDWRDELIQILAFTLLAIIAERKTDLQEQVQAMFDEVEQETADSIA